MWLPLVDPGDPALVRGRLRLSVRAASVEGMERQLWRRLLPLADLDGTGRLTHDQFASLMQVSAEIKFAFVKGITLRGSSREKLGP